MQTISSPTLRRLPSYLRTLRVLQEQGETHVSAPQIAALTGQEAIVARKDLASTAIVGKPRVGFEIPALIKAIEGALGWDNVTDAFLVGVGNLGRALLAYEGFAAYGLKIVAAFDANPDLHGSDFADTPIFPLEKLVDLTPRLRVHLGILAVPPTAAQMVADKMVKAGITGIWNFTPTLLSVPESIIVQREDMSVSLSELSYKISSQIALEKKETA